MRNATKSIVLQLKIVSCALSERGVTMIKGLGERLQQSRINSKLSRKQVAELLGVSTSIVGLYETDVRQPSLSALMKLASIYKVTTDYLLGCEPIEKTSLSLNGLSAKQIEALTLTYKCFTNQSL